MEAMNPNENLSSLRATIAKYAKNEGPTQTAVPGLKVARRSAPTPPASVSYEPCLCVSVQGVKRLLLGDETFRYEPGKFLVTAVQVPVVGQVLTASAARPFLAFIMALDPKEISQLMVDGDLPAPSARRPGRAMTTGKASPELMATFRRFLDLLNTPADIPILAPMIRREIIYRVLLSDQGARLRQVALAGSHGHQIAQAIESIKTRFAESLRIEELAERVHMSPSAFHQHFRQVTAMSPLQYQKWLRLSEARRLMLAENMSAGTASFQVGYESPSQFSREYRRLFQKPPLQDISDLRKTAIVAE
jgi:AraC-like DNA-binding protein